MTFHGTMGGGTFCLCGGGIIAGAGGMMGEAGGIKAPGLFVGEMRAPFLFYTCRLKK